MLKEKFDMAHQVRQRRKDGRRMLLPKYLRSKPHSELDLVYLVTSPDYCEFDVKRGSLGTKGRECDPVGFTLSPTSHLLPWIICTGVVFGSIQLLFFGWALFCFAISNIIQP
jgi:hypothetical protein